MASSILALVSWKGDAGSSISICRKASAGSSICISRIDAAGSSNWIYRKAAAGSSICSISRKTAAGSSICSISRKAAAGSSICISNWISRKKADASRNLLGCCSGRINTMSLFDESALCPSSLPSPWLMLPPAFEGGDMVYQFYSLAENKVLSLRKRGGGDDEVEFVGSSHGWLVSFNWRIGDLFLYNPLSERHIKLPPIRTLPMEDRLRKYGGYECLSNVIISCPPDEEDCRAMMIYGPENRLAFCCPGRSTEWTSIGALFHELKDRRVARSYEACVFSSSQKLFYCITQYDEFEAWDLGDPRSPRMIPLLDISVDEEEEEEDYPVASEEWERIKEYCFESKSLVVVEHSEELFHVRRFTMDRMGPDGSPVKTIYCGSHRGSDVSLPYKTIDFDVRKYDHKDRAWKYMDSSLDGLALFIGLNHSFALSATDQFPELKPNTIYFTDVLAPPNHYLTYGGHDMGIFHYENRTLSSCYYPCDYQSIKRIVPPPMWFTPNPF